MPDIKYHSAVTGRDPEILKLLGDCFPEYWGEHTAKGVFPHREVAFIAENEGVPVGHVGVMPFEVFTGNGQTVSLAGIASVATDPKYRGLGIAGALCRMALEWGRANGIVAMPLFTSLFSVYEKSGWQVCRTPLRTVRIAPRTLRHASDMTVKKAAELTAAEKSMIMAFYENQPPFPGKVRRSADGDFHSWGRIFRRPDYIFYLDADGYGLEIEGVLAELCSVERGEDALLRRILSVRNSPLDCAVPCLTPDEQAFILSPSPVDPFHGEQPMWNWTAPLAAQDEFSRVVAGGGFYFPLADKF